MVIRYFDASALAKLYLQESESRQTYQIFHQSRPATSSISFVEVAAAITRSSHHRRISLENRDRLLQKFDRDFGRMLVIEFDSHVKAHVRRYLLNYPLRTGDAIQLTTCFVIQEILSAPIEFVTYDQGLAKIAISAGLSVLP